MDLKEQAILGGGADTHWYYRSKAAAMLRLLRGAPVEAVLDVGAGSGFFARQVLARTAAKEAVCVDPHYPEEHAEMEAGKPIRFVRRIAHFDGDLILMMDVLEHVANDTALLREYAALARPGTRVLITVPAHRWMWSGHDVFLEHYRRYTVRDVDRLVARSGLALVSSAYHFGLTLPLAAGVRLGRRLNPFRSIAPGSDMRVHSPPVNAGLAALSAMELAWLGANRIAGLSVFALARVR